MHKHLLAPGMNISYKLTGVYFDGHVQTDPYKVCPPHRETPTEHLASWGPQPFHNLAYSNPQNASFYWQIWTKFSPSGNSELELLKHNLPNLVHICHKRKMKGEFDFNV